MPLCTLQEVCALAGSLHGVVAGSASTQWRQHLLLLTWLPESQGSSIAGCEHCQLQKMLTGYLRHMISLRATLRQVENGAIKKTRQGLACKEGVLQCPAAAAAQIRATNVLLGICLATKAQIWGTPVYADAKWVLYAKSVLYRSGWKGCRCQSALTQGELLTADAHCYGAAHALQMFALATHIMYVRLVQ